MAIANFTELFMQGVNNLGLAGQLGLEPKPKTAEVHPTTVLLKK